MEKRIEYNGRIYLVKKDNDEVTIMRDENGTLIELEQSELDDVVTFIGGTYVVNNTTPKDEIREDIDKKIKSGEYKTIDEITEILNNSSLSEEDKEELLEGFKVTLDNQITSDVSVEELDEYKEKIKTKLDEYRKPNEFLLSEFTMINGIMHHRLVMYTTNENGEISEEELEHKSFEYNQRLIDHLIDPSLQEFASSAPPLRNEYQIETNVAGDTAKYEFVGENNTSVKINDISKAYADRLQKTVENTEVEHKNYTPEKDLEMNQESYDNIQIEDENQIYEVDENGERIHDKPMVRVRTNKDKDKHGFINWKFWLIIVAILIIGMFLLTKFVLLK